MKTIHVCSLTSYQKKLYSLFLACTLLASVTSPLAYAEEEMYTLPSITVTSTGEKSEIAKVPANVQIITEGEIKRTNAKNLGELLEKTTTFHFIKYPNGNTDIYMRGYKTGSQSGSDIGDGVLVLIDGRRTATGNLSVFPVGNVERVEIVRGPSSVLYGGNAMGGVINIISKKGTGELKGSAGLSIGMDRTNNINKSTADFDISGASPDNKFGYAVAIDTATGGDYAVGSTADNGAFNNKTYKNTGYHNTALSGNFTLNPADDQSITAFLSYYTAPDGGSPNSFPGSAGASNNYDYGNIALNYTGKIANYSTLAVDTYFIQNSYMYQTTGTYGGESFYAGQHFGGKIQATNPIPYAGNIIVGAEYALGSLTNDNFDATGATKSPYFLATETHTIGVFAQHNLPILDVLNISYGARYDQYIMATEDENSSTVTATAASRNFGALSWRAGVAYTPLSWLTVRANAGSAYTPPTTMELVGNYTSSGTTYIANADLGAEKSLTYEGGVRIDKFGFLVDLNYFYTNYFDKIVAVSTAANTMQAQNLDRQNVAGFEFAAKYRISLPVNENNLFIMPYVSADIYTLRESIDEKKNLTTDSLYIPPFVILAGFNIAYGMVDLDLNVRFNGERDEVIYPAPSYAATPITLEGTAIVNAQVTVRPTEALEVFLAGSNLTNEYYTYKDGYPLEGIAGTLGVRYSF